jgi:hypothetical protein
VAHSNIGVSLSMISSMTASGTLSTYSRRVGRTGLFPSGFVSSQRDCEACRSREASAGGDWDDYGHSRNTVEGLGRHDQYWTSAFKQPEFAARGITFGEQLVQGIVAAVVGFDDEAAAFYWDADLGPWLGEGQHGGVHIIGHIFVFER